MTPKSEAHRTLLDAFGLPEARESKAKADKPVRTTQGTPKPKATPKPEEPATTQGGTTEEANA